MKSKFIKLFVLNFTLLFLGVFCFIFIGTLIVPTLVEAYSEFGAELPFFTKIYINFINIFLKSWVLLIPFLLILISILASIIGFLLKNLDNKKLLILNIAFFFVLSGIIIGFIAYSFYLPVYSLNEGLNKQDQIGMGIENNYVLNRGVYELIIPKEYFQKVQQYGNQIDEEDCSQLISIAFLGEKGERVFMIMEFSAKNLITNPPEASKVKDEARVNISGYEFYKIEYGIYTSTGMQDFVEYTYGYSIILGDRSVFIYSDTLDDSKMEEILEGFVINQEECLLSS